MTARVFGVFDSNGDRRRLEGIRQNISADDGLIVADDATSLIACWGVDPSRRRIDRSGVSVIATGRPRLRNGSGREAPSAIVSEIANRYETSGDAPPSNITGNYALLIVDNVRRRLLLAIDRAGIESMYYTQLPGGGIAYSSDLGTLRRYVAASAPLSNQAVYNYAYFHTVPAPLTIYSDVYKLPLSSRLVYGQGGIEVSRYWMPSLPGGRPPGISELQQSLMERLRAAVVRDMSQPGTGAFLSGGLDSSTVCGLMAEASDSPVTAVTVGFDQAGYDEASFARAAATHFNLDHQVHYITPDEVADSIPLIAHKYAEPFGNSSVVPTYVCALTARQHGLSTLLAGDGGDELFGGNSRYVKMQVFEIYRNLPTALRRFLIDPLFAGDARPWHIGPLRKVYRYVEQARVPLPDRLQTYNLLETHSPASLFQPWFLADVDPSHPLGLLREEYSAAADDLDVLERMLVSDWRFILADNDIRKVSRMCELAGVEVRYPFLDDDVVDFSLTIPSRLKINRFRLRHFYRQTVRGFLPPEVINKSKHGFGLPFGEWLLTSQRLQEMVYDALTDLGRRKIFEQTFIDSLIDDHRNAHAAYYGNMVWVLAMLQWWLESHASGMGD